MGKLAKFRNAEVGAAVREALSKMSFEVSEAGKPAMTGAQRAAYEAVCRMLAEAGIPVEVLSEEAMEALAGTGDATLEAKRKKKTAPETALPGDESPFKGTAISDADGAKVLQKLDALVKEYEENPGNPVRTFIGDVADALGIRRTGKSSRYATFETRNGRIVTIRLSNHNATVSNFDNAGEAEGISIVISRNPNSGVENDGTAHVVEFFYSDKALCRAEGRPLAQIACGIRQSLYSGEYVDTTGLAVRQEVNGDELRERPRLMTVYHGSSAKFDTFGSSHIGEGAGSQAYGWALRD